MSRRSLCVTSIWGHAYRTSMLFSAIESSKITRWRYSNDNYQTVLHAVIQVNSASKKLLLAPMRINATRCSKNHSINYSKRMKYLSTAIKDVMHQSIPAVPIPPPRALAGHLLMFQSRGGAFEILSLPGGRAFTYPRDDPEAFDIFVRFWSRI